MKNLKRHWRVITVVVAALVLGGAFWLSNGHRSAVIAQGGGGYDAADEAERHAVTGVLAHIDLDRDALIALNLSANQAESVYAAARTWQANNESTLQSRRTTIAAKTNAVRAIERDIRTGPYDADHEDELTTARQELNDAETAYDATFNSLKTGINYALSESQRATWAALQNGFDHAMPLRMLDLTGEQRRALARAERHYKLRQAAAKTDQERAAAVSARNTAWNDTFTQDQKNVVDAYRGYYASSSENVAEAFETVLPPA